MLLIKIVSKINKNHECTPMLPVRVSRLIHPRRVYTKYNIALIYTTFIPLYRRCHTQNIHLYFNIYTTTPNISTHIRSGPIVFPLLHGVAAAALRRWRYNDDRACENYMGVRGSEPPAAGSTIFLYTHTEGAADRLVLLCDWVIFFYHIHYTHASGLSGSYDCRIVVEKYIFFSHRI